MRIPHSRFVPLGADMLETVRAWRNSSRIRNNMLSDQLISTDQQQAWFSGLQGDASRLYLVFHLQNLPVGMLYFSDIDEQRCSWGCYIGAEAVWPGSGLLLEVAALDFAFSRFGVNCLHAAVLEFNKSPQRMHKAFGYRLVSRQADALWRGGQRHALLHYEYLRDEWQDNREGVLAQLPPQIGGAVALMTFNDG